MKKIDFFNKISNIQIMHQNNAFNDFLLIIVFQKRKTRFLLLYN